MPIFIVNPKATDDDIDCAISDRLTQARAVCQFAINSQLGSTGDFMQGTFWAIDSLVEDAEQMYGELTEREIKRIVKKGESKGAAGA